MSTEGEHGPVQRFRGGLVFKAHRLVYHYYSILGSRVIKKKKKESTDLRQCAAVGAWIRAPTNSASISAIASEALTPKTMRTMQCAHSAVCGRQRDARGDGWAR